jgi:hypothetical protein
MMNAQGDQAPAEQQKMLKEFENSSMKTINRTIHELADTAGVSYGVCREILTENLDMLHIAASSQQCAPPHTRP